MPLSQLLEIKNLCVEFKSDEGIINAVEDINLTLDKNEILGIVGESGSGKSVTALSILKLIQSPPGNIKKGEIYYTSQNGTKVNLLRLTEKKIRKYRGNEISMIFQEPMSSLNPVYKCGKQVAESFLRHNKSTKANAKIKVIGLFKDLHLPRPDQVYDSYPHELSGGQQQRVMIAMAMICNPAILIADEPTTALDVTIQKSILNQLKQLRDEYGMSIIFITHDLGVIAEIADNVAVMYNGKIVEKGKVSEVFKNPEHSYTKGLLACRPPEKDNYSRLPTISDFMQHDAGNIKSFLEQLKISQSLIKKHRKKFYSRQPVVKIQNLKTYFSKRKGLFKPKENIKAVDDVDLTIYPGETLGLVGESGCGKTTLGRTVLKLIPATDGKVIYHDNDLTNISKAKLKSLRKDLQIIFQDPFSSLNPRITIGSAIQEPMRVFNLYKTEAERRKKTYELLDQVGLNKTHYNRYPHEFSGGQRQRICIARALSVNPRFIICDESVSALDVSVQAQILNLLNDLKRKFNLTFIFISHDLSVVKHMSDRIAVMQDGKIVEINQADKIYQNPQTSYTRNLIDSIPKALY